MCVLLSVKCLFICKDISNVTFKASADSVCLACLALCYHTGSNDYA